MDKIRRTTVRLSPRLHADLAAFARRRGLGLAPAIRLLVGRGLENDGVPTATLATLVASEHAILLVASIIPDGARRVREAAPHAIAAAEERLAMFEGTAEAEARG
jgi:hypothetical protein